MSVTNMGFEKLNLHNLSQISEIKNLGVGDIYSYLFGTIDNDGKVGINKALSTLEQVQFKKSKIIEVQKSLTTKLLKH